ncbi:MAG: hypothetical protein VX028_03735, partial [Nanoarchaeota archaeon]|nr:hypothetical protein [Nanoarchaeota archaeon]
NLLVFTMLIIFSTLPLYVSVKILGGKTSLLKTFLVMLIIAIVSAVLKLFLPNLGTLIAWVVLIWIFHEIFRLKYYKAIIVWILWIFFVFILTFILSLFGLESLYLF